MSEFSAEVCSTLNNLAMRFYFCENVAGRLLTEKCLYNKVVALSSLHEEVIYQSVALQQKLLIVL